MSSWNRRRQHNRARCLLRTRSTQTPVHRSDCRKATRECMPYAPAEHISDENQAGPVTNAPCRVCTAYPGNLVRLILPKYPFNGAISECSTFMEPKSQTLIFFMSILSSDWSAKVQIASISHYNLPDYNGRLGLAILQHNSIVRGLRA